MNNLQTPELLRWGSDKPDQVLIGVHGFAGTRLDYNQLGPSLVERQPGLQVVSFNRGRAPELKPDDPSGTGAIDANAAELLMVAGELAQDGSTNILSLAGHSLGAPTIAAAFQLVMDERLPGPIASEQKRLEEIMAEIGSVSLIAPAGFTNAYALTPLGGFAGHSLARAISNGARGIISDSESFSDLWGQRARATGAIKYLSHLVFSVEECIDACGPATMITFADNPSLIEKLSLIAYEDDEIFPTRKILETLKDPGIRATDFAIYEALKTLNPKEALALMNHLSLAGTAGFMALRAVGIFASKNEYDDPFNNDRKAALTRIRYMSLGGKHTTPLTRKGAEELANHISLAA